MLGSLQLSASNVGGKPADARGETQARVGFTESKEPCESSANSNDRLVDAFVLLEAFEARLRED